MFKQRFTLRYGRTIIYFGLNSVKDLEKFINNYRHVHIVTSKNAAYISGALDDVLKLLEHLDIMYQVFNSVIPNPTYDIVEQLADEIKRYGSEVIIAIGGGSVIDVAKVVSAVALCGGRVKDYIYNSMQICGTKPLVAINLTHGTGSEVNRYAVITIDNPKTKFGIASEYFYPIISIEDPRYTLSMPYKQIIYTSLDAFYHAYEAATGRDSSPFVLMLSEEVVRIIVKWLPIALKNIGDVEARYWLLYASMLAGIAIDNSRAHIIHTIENVLSGINTSLPHGAGLGILGPRAATYIHKTAPETSYRILRYLDPNIRPIEEDSDKAGKAIEEFQNMINFNERLSDYGFSKEDIYTIVETALNMLSYSLKLAPFDVDKNILETIYLTSL